MMNVKNCNIISDVPVDTRDRSSFEAPIGLFGNPSSFMDHGAERQVCQRNTDFPHWHKNTAPALEVLFSLLNKFMRLEVLDINK